MRQLKFQKQIHSFIKYEIIHDFCLYFIMKFSYNQLKKLLLAQFSCVFREVYNNSMDWQGVTEY